MASSVLFSACPVDSVYSFDMTIVNNFSSTIGYVHAGPYRMNPNDTLWVAPKDSIHLWNVLDDGVGKKGICC